jgi:hypothetical protein
MASSPQQRNLFADICQRKHGGNENSQKANLRVAPYKASMRERVRIFIGGCGFNGCTLKEICDSFGKLPHQLSGRVSELKADGLVFDSGRRRDDSAVLVGQKRWVNGA